MFDTKTLLLVVGPGRSGTSTLAGTLSKLGAHVAGPHLNANETNPMGFFESSWSVNFHNDVLGRGPVALADARPEAARLAERLVTAADRAALRTYLTEQAAGRGLVVLKDPRIVWLLSTFRSVAADLRMNLAAAVMLRRPVEVIASRLDYYHKPGAELAELGYQARDLAGWINQLTTCEVQTRGMPRAFLSYDEVLTDWRTAVGRALDDVSVQLPVPEPGAHHAVDDFIDPGLNRHRGRWPEGSAILDELRALAERTFDACDALARHTGAAADATAQLDEVRDRYAFAYGLDRAITHDAAVARAARERRKGQHTSVAGRARTTAARVGAGVARRVGRISRDRRART
ncbi:sulfotransferase family protein [Flexivirga oryzae]|uniref:Sulfotransferase family protein n=1 Tax=Flexivirga oryzae TaxID=1794944 RepID=A0A839N9P8_9MICO|nr:hypothetical protein [Flexivirga oryzae]MBB2894480.1 hypothetical protein [Flexivirga oryzae]